MHPGIELRITTPAGVVVECDSDFAHFSTLFRGKEVGEWITLLRHLEGSPLLDDGLVPEVGELPAVLTVEIRAVQLADVEVPDDAGELLDHPDNAEQPADVPGYSRTPIICDGCRHMCPGTPAACCGCGSPNVVYTNFRAQPFCGRCADGADPHVGRRRRWPWSRGDR